MCNSGNSIRLLSGFVVVVALFYFILFYFEKQLPKQMLFLACTPAKVSDN